MTPERWRQIRSVLDAALEVSPGDRAAWLDRRCGADTELRAEVESLLASHDQGGDLLDTHAVGQSAAKVMRALDSVDAGQRVGPYLVLEEIGRGGMGAVFRGVRNDDEFRRQVAVKVLKRGMDTDYIIRRFQNERQILANFDHPNIAKLYDGGSTPDGLPYFVMEYIPGKPLDEYCDANKLGIRDRLELFRQICSAVQYAHSQNVIHRDIKPGNILVTTDRAPKLLDFGIAKIMHPDGSHTGDSTATAFQLMTPEYASPEQVRGEKITPASDIYSLGVVLFRLLTGHGPYRLKTRTPQSMAYAIVESEPSRPSDVVGIVESVLDQNGETRLKVTPESVASAREIDPTRLRKELCGDLDNIVLKAVAKEPERRYASAEEFSEDVRRYLEGLPVTARRPTLPYRASKWMRRNPAWAFVAVLSVLAAATGILTWRGLMPGASSPQSTNSGKFRPAIAVLGFRNLSARPEVAWLSPTFAELLTTELGAGGRLRTVPPDDLAAYLQETGASPSEGVSTAALRRVRERAGQCYVVTGSYLSLGDGPNARLRLDVRLLDSENGEVLTSINESGAQSDLLNLVAKAGSKLRAKLSAGASLSDADETRMRASQPASAEAARLYSEGLAAFRAFRTLEARDLLQQAVATDTRHAMSYSALATTLTSLGYDAKARAAARRAFELTSGLSREEALFIEGRYRETTRSWPAAVEIYRTLWGFFPDNLEYGLRLAAVQIPAGKPQDALKTVEALRQYPKPLNEDPRIDLSEADAALALQDYRRAEQAASRAIDKGERQNFRILVARADLADARALAGLGRHDRALERIRHARAIYEQAGHRRGVAQAAAETANVHESRGDTENARAAYEESLNICRQIENRSGVALALNNLGVLFHRQGDFARAIAYHRQTLELRRELEDRSGEALALGNIGNAMLEQGDLAGSARHYGESLAIYRQIGQQRPAARILTSLGMVARDQGNLPRAKDLVEESLAIRRQIDDSNGGLRAEHYRALLAYDNGDFREARAQFESLLESRRKLGDKEWVARTLDMLALMAIEDKDPARARKLLDEAQSLREQVANKNGIADTQLVLARLAIAEGKPADGERLARAALAEYEREHAVVAQAEALVTIARTLKAQKRLGDAERSLSRAAALAQSAGAGRVTSEIAHVRSGLRF